MRIERDFYNRPLDDQEWFLLNTWCDRCHEADLGMTDPQEFEEDGDVLLFGICRRCGSPIFSKIAENG